MTEKIKVAQATINNSILGWMLVPRNDEGNPIVAALYAMSVEEWQKAPRGELATMKDKPLPEMLKHVLEIAEGMNFKISVCGNRKTRPVLRIWPPKNEDHGPVIERDVDLKWACWSQDWNFWDEYGGNIWDEMKAAWAGTGPRVKISTGPRKEIRGGSVEISQGKASGYFWSGWDEIHDLANTLGADDCFDEEGEIVEDSLQAFAECIPHSYHTMDPGLDIDFEVKARSFRKLMERIDNEEGKLIKKNDEEWALLEEIYKKGKDDDRKN